MKETKIEEFINKEELIKRIEEVSKKLEKECVKINKDNVYFYARGWIDGLCSIEKLLENFKKVVDDM